MPSAAWWERPLQRGARPPGSKACGEGSFVRRRCTHFTKQYWFYPSFISVNTVRSGEKRQPQKPARIETRLCSLCNDSGFSGWMTRQQTTASLMKTLSEPPHTLSLDITIHHILSPVRLRFVKIPGKVGVGRERERRKKERRKKKQSYISISLLMSS